MWVVDVVGWIWWSWRVGAGGAEVSTSKQCGSIRAAVYRCCCLLLSCMWAVFEALKTIQMF